MMTAKHLLICFAFFVSSLQIVACQNNDTSDSVEDSGRNGKVFSLFSIVAFKNSGCRSSSTLTTGQSPARNGTCFTSSECSAKGGTASGNCAAGFGVCCLFLISASGSVINQNCTYLRNPDFPNVFTGTSALSYTINKSSSDVCYLRLDFEQFSTLGPRTNTDESTAATGSSGGACLDDALKFTASSGHSIPTICGVNTGQHIYVDLGNGATDNLMMAFSFAGTSTSRIWEIKVSQIECNNLNRPPDGCLQYLTGITGRITTFNFFGTGIRQAHLANQDVTTCIRRAAGFCCVRYQVCSDVTDAFTIDSSTSLVAGAAVSQVNSQCTNDYVGIPAAATTCGDSTLYNRFCSPMLDPFNANLGLNIPVCTCTAPFFVHFRTDGGTDIVGADTMNFGVPRGVCLDYMQLPC